MKMFKIFLSVFVAGLFLAACGGGGQSGGTPVSFTIDMKEYAFTPASLDLKVGQQVTLNLTNSGQLQHEIMFGRDVIKNENNRPFGYQTDMFQAAGVTPEVTQQGPTQEEETEEHEPSGFMVGIAPGATATVTFPVTKEMVGQWEMGCFEQDGVHYDAGMKGTVTVTQ